MSFIYCIFVVSKLNWGHSSTTRTILLQGIDGVSITPASTKNVMSRRLDNHFWSYFAGCIDCDGWITKSTHINTNGEVSNIYRYVVGFTQHSKHEDGVKWMSEQLKIAGVKFSYSYRNSNTPHNTKMINITIKQRESIIKVFKNIIPYLKFKQSLAIEGLKYTEDSINKRPLVSNVKIKAKNETNIYWTETDLNTLDTMTRDGFNNIAIASKLNRSVQSVSQKKSKLKSKLCHGDVIKEIIESKL